MMAYESDGHATSKAAMMDLIANLPSGESVDIFVHAPGCRVEEIDLCTCEPTLFHHGHEAAECEGDE